MHMPVALLITRLCLAAVFLVAGGTKLLATRKFADSLVGFGLPPALAAPLSGALPALELAVALALLPAGTAWAGAVAALALLLLFAAAMAINLARGATPECNCFGQLHSTPVSWKMFGRNLGLAAAAGWVVAAGPDNPGLSAFGWMSALSTAEIANLTLVLMAIALLAATLVVLRRVAGQQAAVLARIEGIRKLVEGEEETDGPAETPVERADAEPPVEGLPVGAPAPGFSLQRLGGGPGSVTLDDLLSHGKPVLLIFVSPNCRPCKALLPLVRPWDRDYGDHLTFALLTKGTAEENEASVARYAGRHLLLQVESTVADEYQARWTPAAVIVGRDGKLATKTTYGDLGIRALVEHAVTTGVGLGDADRSARPLPPVMLGKSLFKVGEPGPRFALPALDDGREIRLEHLLAAGSSLLLFWDPACRFCQAISEDLRSWERNPPPNAPNLAIIASGDPDEMRARRGDFRSLILLDEAFEVAPLYGSNSTPSAVLIDGAGRIASSLAIGGRNVLALAGARFSQDRGVGLPT
jgi:thiol-disulfide isomerase/thioredoxin